MAQEETKHISSVYCNALKIANVLNCKKSAQREMTVYGMHTDKSTI